MTFAGTKRPRDYEQIDRRRDHVQYTTTPYTYVPPTLGRTQFCSSSSNDRGDIHPCLQQQYQLLQPFQEQQEQQQKLELRRRYQRRPAKVGDMINNHMLEFSSIDNDDSAKNNNDNNSRDSSPGSSMTNPCSSVNTSFIIPLARRISSDSDICYHNTHDEDL